MLVNASLGLQSNVRNIYLEVTKLTETLILKPPTFLSYDTHD